MAGDNKIGLPWAVLGKFGAKRPFGELKTQKNAADMASKQDYEHTPYEKSTLDHAREDTTEKHKHGDKPTLNKLGQEKANQVHDDIKKVDPQNIAGAIPPFLDQMKKMLNNTDPMNALKGMVGGGGYSVMMSTNAQNAAANQANTLNNQPKPGDPCNITEDDGSLTPGTLQYNANSELICSSINITGITIRPIVDEGAL